MDDLSSIARDYVSAYQRARPVPDEGARWRNLAAIESRIDVPDAGGDLDFDGGPDFVVASSGGAAKFAAFLKPFAITLGIGFGGVLATGQAVRLNADAEVPAAKDAPTREATASAGVKPNTLP